MTKKVMLSSLIEELQTHYKEHGDAEVTSIGTVGGVDSEDVRFTIHFGGDFSFWGNIQIHEK